MANKFGGMMKKVFLSVLTGMMILLLNGGVFAGVYEYRPYYIDGSGDGYYDLDDLDHYSAYSWKIDARTDIATIKNNKETIIGVSLFFENIRNWDDSSNVLHVSLIDSGYAGNFGVREITNDNQNTNYFGDTNLLFRINNLSDTAQNVTVSINQNNSNSYSYDGVTYNGTLEEDSDSGLYRPAGGLSKLVSYISDGIFKLGFDPDCHFYNDGIKLTILTAAETTTSVVPEPATLLLFGAGLLGFASRMRKKSESNCL
ncbi:MAG: PEP-CTERM sorting domain-containing protein [Desulfobacula sp.]